jgi:protein transport protein SEC61 subunit beta
MASKKGSSLKYFSEDNAGFTIQPKTVLIVSLVYIGIVVLLHIFSKVGGSETKVEQEVKVETE